MGFKVFLNIYSILPNIKNFFTFINCKNIKIIYNFKFLFKKNSSSESIILYFITIFPDCRYPHWMRYPPVQGSYPLAMVGTP